MENIIATYDLNHYFGAQRVLKNLSLAVPKGSVFGFLGPNGAGKTTSIRILLGLIKTPPNKAFLFGKDISHDRIGILKRTGALIENPSLYRHLSGYDNLRITARISAIPDKRIHEVLELVELEKDAKRKTKDYSLGMCQRLGIAQALLSNPDLLVLDEPSNGLDPNGIIAIRELIRSLAKDHGKTIFVSSHLLAEVQKMCTHLAIINKGELLFQGTMQQLEKRSAPTCEIITSNNEKAAELLRESAVEILGKVNGSINIKVKGPQEAGRVNKLLMQHDLEVYHLNSRQHDLEQMFLEMTTQKTN